MSSVREKIDPAWARVRTQLEEMQDSFVPFARTRAEREANGDPRPSIEERYPSHEAYVDAVRRVCERLVGERLMLQADADRFVATARERNPLDPSVPLGPLVRVLVAPGGE